MRTRKKSRSTHHTQIFAHHYSINPLSSRPAIVFFAPPSGLITKRFIKPDGGKIVRSDFKMNSGGAFAPQQPVCRCQQFTREPSTPVLWVDGDGQQLRFINRKREKRKAVIIVIGQQKPCSRQIGNLTRVPPARGWREGGAMHLSQTLQLVGVVRYQALDQMIGGGACAGSAAFAGFR